MVWWQVVIPVIVTLIGALQAVLIAQIAKKSKKWETLSQQRHESQKDLNQVVQHFVAQLLERGDRERGRLSEEVDELKHKLNVAELKIATLQEMLKKRDLLAVSLEEDATRLESQLAEEKALRLLVERNCEEDKKFRRELEKELSHYRRLLRHSDGEKDEENRTTDEASQEL